MCVSLGQCVWGLDYGILLLPSGPLSDDQRDEEEAEDTDLHRVYRTGELLRHCVCVYTAQIFFSSVFLAMLKDWRAVSAVRMFITRGPELHAGLDISVTLCLKIDAADISNWRRDGVTDGWRDGWVEKRFLMASGTVYALISDCSLTVHIHM